MTLYYDRFDSPIGPLTIAADEHGLRHVLFPENRYDAPGREHWVLRPEYLEQPRRQLLEYLQGTRRLFDLVLSPIGTDFQRQVWLALADIPYGQTWSYARLASHVGRPGANRAVGAANGRNPLPIVLPCHRVIGSNGTLTGFGGGLPTKAALLRLEGIGSDLFT
ncbi:methylated-DNA--[protein]-cysteine S-methyltransferase [Pseudomonas sp. ABC1]|uniref:methylated-DNA--[protein]-cysteine S-methyltransferase n=1 Tax=Pseudomonas sp. ABC1 TaxID=2748080 RepID=UPI0015C2E39A|nr:methylated-DNA--[protein]-cysteine S-methyltransferase [Pseudomonas sp. ABC1]QLF94021.1 methylated-DNA--[protein]-cysteine S-methyltransferase [Pseudomonas sp. ABC1]